jgi:hypothetical protein
VLNLTSITLPALNVDALGERVRKLCYEGGVIPTGFALEDASYLGVVVEAPQSLLSTTPFSTFERLGASWFERRWCSRTKAGSSRS